MPVENELQHRIMHGLIQDGGLTKVHTKHK